MKIEFPAADTRLADLATAAEALNRFHWHLTAVKRDDHLALMAGELLMARFDDGKELSAFVAGMALALTLLPEEVVAELDRWAGA